MSSPSDLSSPSVGRLVILGAGAVGATLAAELVRAGRETVLVARGAHLEALRSRGLTYVRPDGERLVQVPVVAGPEEVELVDGDVLVVATKSQDTEAALAPWAHRPVKRTDGSTGVAAEVLPVVLLQNGLENERIALRRFSRVLGAVIWIPSAHLSPGVVVSPGTPAVAVVWLGGYPGGQDPAAEGIAAELRAADFLVQLVADISRWKAGKLIGNLVNVLDALYAPSPLRDRVLALAREEALEVFGTAGIEVADVTAESTLDLTAFAVAETPGHRRGGSSTWQSLARSGSLETDFLNGEVVLQARLVGRQAPVNAALQSRAARAAAAGTRPGSLDDTDLAALLAGTRGRSARGADVLLDVAELAARSAPGAVETPVLLDVRWALGDPHGREHYREAHIPGAVYVDLDTELAARPEPLAGRHPLPAVADLQAAARRWGVRAGSEVVVYDDAGGLAAARAWWLLRWAGVDAVRILDGGLAAWRNAGHPLAAGDETALVAGDVVLTAGGLPVLSADEAALLASSGVLLDARAGERYRGETEPIDPRAGHIPGAVSAPTGENLAPDGAFLGPAALVERFAGYGVGTTSDVGVYCGSGVTAAHQVAALAVAGVQAALYPGSWSAWSNDPSRPVATGPDPARP